MSSFEAFKKGFKDGIPIFLGYLAVSFSFGIQGKIQGLNLFQAGLFSGTNVTSAGQFAGLTSIVTHAGLLEVILTQFIINSRYILMSSALSQKINPKTSFLKRALMAFGVTDEIFALSVGYPGDSTPTYTYGLMAIAIPGWVLGTVLGVVSGDLLASNVLSALSIALYGMLVAIIVPPSKKHRVLKGVIVFSMASSFLLSLIPIIKDINPGIRLIILTFIITSFAAYFYPIEEKNYD